MMRSKANKLVQITRVPIRVLCKARDFYVKSMLNFAGSGRVGYGSIGGAAAELPRSFSVKSSRASNDEELKQLMGLLSAKAEAHLRCRKVDGRSYSKGMRRSYSVGVGMIGRIEEDRACSFREDDNDGDADSYHTSTSDAVRRIRI